MTFDLSFADEGKTIAAQVGSELMLALPVIGGTGYRWQLEPPSPEAVLVREEPSHEQARRVGGSLDQVFRLAPQTAGRVPVKFTLRRAWEKSVEPERTFRITLVIRA